LENAVFPLLMATLHASTSLIHKSHFARVGLFDAGLPLTQDYDFLFRAMRGQRTLFLSEPLLLSRLHAQSGKNSDDRFGRACAVQYRHFADALAYGEIRGMFSSPRALHLRLAAMMKARDNTLDASAMFARVARLPEEYAGHGQAKLLSLLEERAGGTQYKVCIFGAGYQGKILKCELEHRGIPVACFCDNDARKHGMLLDGALCISADELSKAKDDTLVIVAADVSDVIAARLRDAGFSRIAIKKELDALIMETPPTM
jgi:hypothetical protein